MGQRNVLCAKKYILEKMEKEGIPSIIELSRRSGVDQPTLSALISGRISPRIKKGGWRKEVVDLATFFECLPGALFGIKKRSRACDKMLVNAEECFGLMRNDVLLSHVDDVLHPECAVFRNELARRHSVLFAGLTPREKYAVHLCFGFDGKGERTLEEAGKEMEISRKRVSQLKYRALEKLQRSIKLKQLYSGE